MLSSPRHKEPSSRFPPELARVWLWVGAWTAISVVFCAVAYWMHLQPTYYRALSAPNDHLADFVTFKEKFTLLHTADFFRRYAVINYPAPLILMYALFYKLGDADLGTFVLVSVLTMLVPAALFARSLVHRGLASPMAWTFVATLLFCSWPIVFAVDRANMEVFVWLALLVATWAFATGRSYLAAALFGVAASLKLFPFVFLGLFLSTRRWKPLALGIAVLLLVTWGSLYLVGPTVAIAAHGTTSGLQTFKAGYMVQYHSWEAGIDHSLFGTVKFIDVQFFHHALTAPFSRSLSVYMYVTVLGGLLLYVLRIRKLPLLNQVLILSVVSVLLPSVSFDYTLVHLYYAFAMLIFVAIDAHRRSLVVPGMRAAFTLLAFLTSYQAFFVFQGRRFVMPGQPLVLRDGSFVLQAQPLVVLGQRFEGQAKCVALLLLLVIALRYPFGAPLDAPQPADALSHPDASRIATT